MLQFLLGQVPWFYSSILESPTFLVNFYVYNDFFFKIWKIPCKQMIGLLWYV